MSEPEAKPVREHIRTLAGGIKIYKVQLVGGPYDGTHSVCSHNTVMMCGERYLRGADDRYYHTPEGAGKN